MARFKENAVGAIIVNLTRIWAERGWPAPRETAAIIWSYMLSFSSGDEERRNGRVAIMQFAAQLIGMSCCRGRKRPGALPGIILIHR